MATRVKSISKLNARIIKSMMPGDEIRDPGTRGLSIWRRATVTGWSLQYQSPTTGKRTRFKLGEWPHVDIEEAQRRAREARDLIQQGIDPANPPKTHTAAEILDQYLSHVRAKKRTAYEIERVLRKHLVPAFGDMEIDHVRRRDVLSMFDSIEKPYAANHALAYASTFLNWCVDRDLIEANPAYGIKRTTRNPERSRERVLADDELKALWQASLTNSGFPAYYGQIVRLLMLTGARRNEVASMRPEQIDGSWWTIPGDITKNGREHLVYLTPLAKKQLPEPRPDGKYFTPGVTWPRYAKAIYAQAKQQNVRLHDLRRTMASGMQALSIRPEVIEACLNHMPTGIRRVYQRHGYTAEKEEAWRVWEGFVKGLVGTE